MMKVAFFIGGLNRGGMETLVLDVFRKQEISPFECVLIYRNEGDLSEDYRSTGVKMIRIKPHGLKLGYIRSLRKVLEREKVDVLHAQTLLNAFLGLFCVAFSRVKLVASFHGFRSSFKERLLTHFVMWFSDASVFVSEYEKKWFINHTGFAPAGRCNVVYNGIDFSKFTRQYPVPDFLIPKPTFPEHFARLVMVGSFVSGRSHMFLCKCIKRLRDEGTDDFQFFFVGRQSQAEPELYEDCVRFCDENGLSDIVHFVGGRSDVPAILQHIDGFVYSTNHDSFGIAVVEAMAVGVPVIVNDWDVMKEITENGDLARLYKTQDVDDCVMVLKEFLKSKSEYLSQAQMNASAVRERFSIERHIDRLYSVYKAVYL